MDLACHVDARIVVAIRDDRTRLVEGGPGIACRVPEDCTESTEEDKLDSIAQLKDLQTSSPIVSLDAT